MATYKLIQDIEAEDHILGPLTLRQFIFAIIGLFLSYISFLLVSKGVAFMLVVTVPPAIFFLFFAMLFGRDQPTEVWFLAKLRFWFKPRKRVWSQDGIKELVTITVPKKIEKVYTNGLTQGEVKSRLEALATTLDTRGWAVKNIGPATQMTMPPSTDRLVGNDATSWSVPDTAIMPSEDILDNTFSPVAQQFSTMIDQSTQAHRQQIVNQLNASPAQSQPQQQATDDAQWFMQQNSQQPSPYGNMRTMQPPVTQTPQTAAPASLPQPTPQQTTPADPAILSLANNDDLNVSTIAREAQRARGGEDGEVTISLH